ncbi:F/Y-rich N-terminus-domain-containing protein [Gilbertella persicaria]|uniref:Transforming growth factor beta regulator 1 n=1 Tax=Rhizopus stolonifer TaxID=4846 RepID=A0A367KLY1_RHIST|nr:F/Y-rich N-terminus-domain-containing protein [Gilbertella persicaria]KAI8095095.1 F/Y-rich N-terminus-domain-containing protein [Gilbertella persicaria]RCI03161.1 transforming growth factor beta regulator 1 [Rhizopus stolonifer]
MTDKGVDVACQTEIWEDTRMEKYRKMKRKLIELLNKQKEAQTTLDKANRKTQKRTRQKKPVNEDAMDISQDEEVKNQQDEQQQEEEEDEEEEDELDEDDDHDTPAPKKTRISRRKRVTIPRDENGNIQLPFQIASLNVISLGKIDWERPGFHNERYIFPIGYTVERTYMSMVDPHNQTTYTCKVEDGQDGPLFTLQASDAPSIELSARTATGVWALVLKKANEVRQKETSNAISGPEYYGFAHPLVIKMIEELDGVDNCSRYTRRTKDNI